jgi:hypothetical protein
VVFARIVGASLLTLLLVPSASAQPLTRQATLASLERVMAGEAPHTNYGEGHRLQTAVNAAFERGDSPVIRVAQRAARPILSSASAPVGTVADPPAITIDSLTVLELRRRVTYSAEIFLSVNGAAFVHAGRIDAQDRPTTSLKIASAPRTGGVHHLRFEAYMTYGAAGSDLPNEIRRLADVTYAIYDPISGGDAEIAQFVTGPSRMSAQQLDAGLPDIPFLVWVGRLVPGRGTPPASVL